MHGQEARGPVEQFDNFRSIFVDVFDENWFDRQTGEEKVVDEEEGKLPESSVDMYNLNVII